MSGIFQRKVLAIVSACVGLASLALAGDHINNGAGLAERNVLFAYANLEKYIGLCLDFPSCRITPYERGLLERIRNAMPTERAAPEQIRFLSEREHPGTFIIDGEMKIAKTGSQVGSAIYMNLDLLYPGIANPGSLNQTAFGFFDLSVRSIPLAVLAGLAQYWQTKMLMNKREKKGSMASMMNKQMLYMMPVITIVIGSSFPAGLTLYWFATTFFSALQQLWMFRGQPKSE